jgi:hypothetical protein
MVMAAQLTAITTATLTQMKMLGLKLCKFKGPEGNSALQMSKDLKNGKGQN